MAVVGPHVDLAYVRKMFAANLDPTHGAAMLVAVNLDGGCHVGHPTRHQRIAVGMQQQANHKQRGGKE